MGMAARAEIARRLMAARRGADTPVVVVRRGTTTTQAECPDHLAGLAGVELGPPCTIVIGAVAGLDLLDPGVGPPDGHLGGRDPGLAPIPARSSRRCVAPVRRCSSSRLIAVADPPDGGARRALRAEAAPCRLLDWIVLTSADAVERFVGIMRDVRGLGAAASPWWARPPPGRWPPIDWSPTWSRRRSPPTGWWLPCRRLGPREDAPGVCSSCGR